MTESTPITYGAKNVRLYKEIIDKERDLDIDIFLWHFAYFIFFIHYMYKLELIII